MDYEGIFGKSVHSLKSKINTPMYAFLLSNDIWYFVSRVTGFFCYVSLYITRLFSFSLINRLLSIKIDDITVN